MIYDERSCIVLYISLLFLFPRRNLPQTSHILHQNNRLTNDRIRDVYNKSTT